MKRSRQHRVSVRLPNSPCPTRRAALPSPAMDKERPTHAGTTASWWSFFAWSGLLLALLVWQAWLTLALFGGAAGWENLTSDQPIVSGAHPQHLYLGTLGAQGLRATGTS